MADDVRTTLQRALTKLKSERVALDRQIKALETAIGAFAGQFRAMGPGRRRRKMNAAARKAIGERMRAYWAKRRIAKARKG
jgi:hypothetical protein